MKLLVFAHTPPPHHGQSFMVAQLLAGLGGTPGLELHHVNARLSRDAADIGHARPGKLLALGRHVAEARRLQREHGLDTLYYVPAPGKRGALLRDWIVMAALRPRLPRLVLHWHAAGLGTWLQDRATPPERALSRRLLGRADLAVVLAETLRADGEALSARRIAVVPNGIPDPCPGLVRKSRPDPALLHALFVGLGSEAKGLLDAVRAVALAGPGVRLTFAGEFADAAVAGEFARLAQPLGGRVQAAGFVQGEAKQRLFAAADVLLLPTRYPHEAQPLVVLEALAHDLPVVSTAWRGIPATLPGAEQRFVEAGRPDQMAAQLARLQAQPPAAGARRAHFLSHLTTAHHLAALDAALRSLDP